MTDTTDNPWRFATAESGVTNAIVRTPHQAQIIDGLLPHQKHAIAVTEDHGLQVEDIEVDPTSFPVPMRVRGERIVSDLDSFLAELKRRPLTETDSTLWGSAERGVLTAVYNDHAANGTDAGWRDDKLGLALVPDPYWARWHEISGKPYRQNDFGDVIEELLHTVIEPDQADLLEIIDSIRASTSGEFESKIERANGSQKLVYKQEHNVSAGRTGQLEVPQTLTLSLRPWDGHPENYQVSAWFRVNPSGGSLTLAVKLKPTREIVRAAWLTITDKVQQDTGKPVYAVK